MSAEFRTEKDPLGDLQVPADALYGVQTMRARQNFPISGLRPLWPFVQAQVWIKKAAALTHKETGPPRRDVADAIVRAATRCWRASTTSTSSSTRTRPARARRTT
jgi:aspartate ammonia-lyase